MSEKITVYERPTCSKCREADKLLRSHDVDFEKVNYYIKPLTAKMLQELFSKLALPARGISSTSEAN